VGPAGRTGWFSVIDRAAGLSEDEGPWQSTEPTASISSGSSQEYFGGETLHALSKRHDISRNLIRIWVEKFRRALSMRMPQRLTFSRLMRRALPRSNGSSANRHWNWSF
ncbi:hypothetical protein NKH53_31835, partial [Mesorhizobium australicum]